MRMCCWFGASPTAKRHGYHISSSRRQYHKAVSTPVRITNAARGDSFVLSCRCHAARSQGLPYVVESNFMDVRAEDHARLARGPSVQHEGPVAIV